MIFWRGSGHRLLALLLAAVVCADVTLDAACDPIGLSGPASVALSADTGQDLARKAGMLVKASLTKSLDILVVADPETQSGKAKKAREYGTRTMADATFWKAVGLNVD